MDTEAWQNLQTTGGALDLSRAVKLRLSGPDALRYLNGQVSNDLRRLATGESLPACLCTHKGKLEALVMISRAADALFITADEVLREFLPLRLEKYLIADDALLEEVTDAWSLVHVFGAAAESSAAVPGIAASYKSIRLGEPGIDLWFPAGAAVGIEISDPGLVETLRIDRRIPAWNPELSGNILPPEARLDEFAIDYHKGCYTGQEVISRLRSVGQVNRKLESLAAKSAAALEAGWNLYAAAEDGSLTTAGIITSAARHPALDKWIALGFVKRSAAGMNLVAALDTGAPRVPVEIRKTLDGEEP